MESNTAHQGLNLMFALQKPSNKHTPPSSHKNNTSYILLHNELELNTLYKPQYHEGLLDVNAKLQNKIRVTHVYHHNNYAQLYICVFLVLLLMQSIYFLASFLRC